MEHGWREETARVTASFDRVADLYRREFTTELDGKPFDRDLLARVAGHFPAGPVLEVGAGFGHIGAELASHGVPVVASDASLGQLREARVFDAGRPLVAADLARLPVQPGTLAGVLAFYCLIYGPPDRLDRVFADWAVALQPGGVVLAAVHAGEGTRRHDEWHGRPVDVTIILRDPDDLAARFEGAGFTIDELTVRPPYDIEETHRCYVVATR